MKGIAMPAGTPIQIRLQDAERNALDHYRRQQQNPPSRAAAARALIRRALCDLARRDGQAEATSIAQTDGRR
jgi:hypothetical protein